MSNSIQHKFFFQHAPEKVWEYLTSSELMELWLMKNDFQPILGYQFQFKTNPIPSLDLDGIFYCIIMEIIPLKKLVYSWKGGPGNGVVTLDSIVEWTLHAKDNGTELQLHHSGFTEENSKIYAGMFEGWLKNIQKINDRLNAQYDATKV
jgi:uncharacterized protein YndB with AHSA1/START domain